MPTDIAAMNNFYRKELQENFIDWLQADPYQTKIVLSSRIYKKQCPKKEKWQNEAVHQNAPCEDQEQSHANKETLPRDVMLREFVR